MRTSVRKPGAIVLLLLGSISTAKAVDVSLTGPSQVCPGMQYTYSASASTGGCFQMTFFENGVITGTSGGVDCPCEGQDTSTEASHTWGETLPISGQVKVQFLVYHDITCSLITETLDVNVRVFAPGLPTNAVFCGSSDTELVSSTGIPYDADHCYYHYQYYWYVPSGWSVVPPSGVTYTPVPGGIKTFSTDVNITTSSSTLTSGFDGNYRVQIATDSIWPWPMNSQSTAWVGAPNADNSKLIYPHGQRGVDPVTLTESTSYLFNVDLINGASGFTWYLPSGFSFVTGEGTSHPTIQTTASDGSYTLYCTADNACGSSWTNSLGITISSYCQFCQRMAQNNGKEPADTTFAKIALYPIPANAEFKVRLRSPAEQDGELSLIDLSGSIKRQGLIQQGSQWITIGTSDLTPGIYFVKITDGLKEYYQKVLVQH